MTKDRWLYVACVVCAIALVVIGWLMTVRRTIAEGFAVAKQSVSETQSVVATEFQEARAQKAQTPSLKQSLKTYLLSKQLIESLKTRIETEAYVPKEEATTTQTP